MYRETMQWLCCKGILAYMTNSDQPEADKPSANDVETSNFGEVISRMLGGVVFTYLVNELIGVAVQVEQAVSVLLAVYLGRDAERIECIGESLIGYVPYDEKIKIVESLLRTNAWDEEFPDLISTLRGLQALRNNLAHSYGDQGMPRATGADEAYQRTMYRRGREKLVTFPSDEMHKMIEDAQRIVSDDLAELVRRSLPGPVG
jgi:hypothetical protein